MNPLTHARRLWSRFSIPPASAEAAVVSLEAGATLIVPRSDVRHIVKIKDRDGRFAVLDSRPTVVNGEAMVVLKRGRKPRGRSDELWSAVACGCDLRRAAVARRLVVDGLADGPKPRT